MPSRPSPRRAPAGAATVRLGVLSLVTLVVVLLGGCGTFGTDERAGVGDGAGDGIGVVASVTDGDTIRVRIQGREERVRLIGIDTPETRGRGGLRECFGAEATQRTKALLPDGTEVRLVRDVELRDRYDRLLAYVYRADDDLFVNLTLAEEGYAAAYTFPPNVAHADEFVAAAAKARDAGRGLWSACGGPDTAL